MPEEIGAVECSSDNTALAEFCPPAIQKYIPPECGWQRRLKLDRPLPLFSVGEGGLPVFEFPELDRFVDAEVFEEHREHGETLAFAREDAADIFDLLRRLFEPPVELVVRPAAAFAADIPVVLDHGLLP